MQTYTTISFQDLFSQSTDHFLNSFYEIGTPNIRDGMDLPFKLTEKERNEKTSPILQLATPEDAHEIVDIYLDIYNGTYPYKEMENVIEVKKMIESSDFRWLLFKTPFNERTIGCFTYQLDFKKKRGYMRGFNVKKSYQGKLDSVKAVIGSMIGVWTEYRNKIKLWYCENRTAHAKSQYLSNVCGIKPIAFLPNKDIFNKSIESDIMHIAYEYSTLDELRSPKVPKVISEVRSFFNYSNERYGLGYFEELNPRLPLRLSNSSLGKQQIDTSTYNQKCGYKRIKFSLHNKESYFKFLYNSKAKNFEKTEYKVSNQEELYLFLWKWLEFIKKYNVRYAESFVSAYEPEYQKLFLKFGFFPRGYIPAWNYNNKTGKFEDSIIFNWYKGSLSTKPKLLDSGKDLFLLANKFTKEI